MRKFTTLVLLTTGLITLGAGMAQGAGFNIYEAGVRATALGGAFTASADDGSALFYNAAGLSFQEGRSASINLMPVNPRFKFRGATTFAGEGAFEEVQHKTYLVPGAYYTARPSEKFSYGLGVYAPFGLGVKWMNPDTFVGRQVSYDVEIQTVYVTPAVSYMVADGLALAVGVDVATQHLNLKRQTPHPTLGGQMLDTQIEGSSNLNVTAFAGPHVPSQREGLAGGHVSPQEDPEVRRRRSDPRQCAESWRSRLHHPGDLAGRPGRQRPVAGQ